MDFNIEMSVNVIVSLTNNSPVSSASKASFGPIKLDFHCKTIWIRNEEFQHNDLQEAILQGEASKRMWSPTLK